MTSPANPSGRTPIDGLRTWTKRDPARIAIDDGATAITFGELLPRVEAMAGAARAALAQAPAGAYLPVVVDRTVASATAALACLLGRVRFFPIDVTAAPELQARLAQRAGNPGRCLVGPIGAPPVPGTRAVDVDGGPMLAAEDADRVDLSGPALVVFSSGSTGDPKGIVLSWDVLESRWRSRDRRDADFGDDRRQPLITPLDSAWGLNVLADVASGFTERIFNVARMRPVEFLAQMAAFAPTAMAIPSQHGRLLAQLPERSVVPLPSVRRANIGSEGFRYEYVRGLRPILKPETMILHSLASTEGGREIVNAFALQDAPEAGLLQLGHIIFPDDLRLVPVEGMADDVAEVHVGGAIASEYLDDPELTAARFYTDAAGRRWWRSGDLVTTDQTGMYVHAGRMDDVVKVGGKLASPSDATAVLLGIDGVRAAITVPVVTDGNTRLVAHVELEPDATVALPDVRAALAARLQPHAVPSAVLRHAKLPVNVRGKVNRAVLMDGPFEPW